MRRGRCGDLRLALRVVDLRYELRREPTAQELMQRLGLTRRTAYRWARACRGIVGESKRNRPAERERRLFPHIERVSQ